MCDVINKLSKEMNLPNWWVEAIAIEYTDCREFGVGHDGLWRFNFNKVKEDDLINALINNKTVISSCFLIHNINKEVFNTRMLESLVSSVPSPLTSDSNSIIVEGLASAFCFPCFFNNIEIVDPKQALNSYFLVCEDGEIWQWRFADLVPLEGSNYVKYVSDYLYLDEFDKQNEKYKELWNYKHSECIDDNLLKNKIAEYFDWIESIRKPLLLNLYELHQQKKVSPEYKSMATTVIPPYMSRFESFKVASDDKGTNRFFYKIDAAPIFYQSCCQHVIKANEIITSICSETEIPPRLDTIYQEKASAIVTGIMCIEAFINHIGYDILPDIWECQEKLALTEKIKVLLTLKGKGNKSFNKSTEPLSSFINYITSRNWLVHSKPKYEAVKSYKQKNMTPMEYYLRDDLVLKMPSHIKELIEFICMAIDINSPAWLEEAPRWSFDKNISEPTINES